LIFILAKKCLITLLNIDKTGLYFAIPNKIRIKLIPLFHKIKGSDSNEF